MKSVLTRAAAFATGIAIASTIAACSSPTPETSVTNLKTNISFASQFPVDWNPANTLVFTLAQQAVYESLIYLDPAEFVWKPLLAEDFEISDDQRSMRIKIREDVEFTDGTHLDAEGAKAALDFAFAGAGHVVLVSRFAPEVTVTGEYELEVTSTAAMNADFLFWFGVVPIASPTAIREDPEGLTAVPVGSGPYIIDEVVPEVSISFERNEAFRDQGAYPFDELEFYLLEDPIAVANALKSGQLNVGAYVDPAYAADLEQAGFPLHLSTAGHWYLQWQDPTGRSAPQLADVRVRQAIAYAFDREAIIDNLEYGYGTVTSQMWGEGSPFHVEGADETYAYDPEMARDLLAEAGYPDGFDLTIPSFSGHTAKYEPVVQQSLAEIGITVTYETFPDFPAWSTAANSGDYGLVLRDTSDLFYNLDLRSIADGGIPEINELFEVIDTGTQEEAQAAEERIGQIVLDEAIGIPLSRRAEVWVSAPEITVEGSVVAAGKPLLAIQLAR